MEIDRKRRINLRSILIKDNFPTQAPCYFQGRSEFSNITSPWMREVIWIGIYGLEKISLLVTSHQAINENYSYK